MIKLNYLFKYLYEIKLLNFNCLKLGLIGFPDGNQISLEDVQEYISDFLNQHILEDETANILVDTLLVDSKQDVIQILNRLLHDDELDKKHIAATELRFILNNCHNDYVYDLIEIASFWDKWKNWANFKILDYQGVVNDFCPKSYYSQEHYYLVYKQSLNWCRDILGQ